MTLHLNGKSGQQSYYKTLFSTYDLQTLKSKFSQIQDISTNYPVVATLHPAFHKQNPKITEDDVHIFYQRHA